MIAAVSRLLLVSHRSLDQAGGATARWRSFARRLPEHGWEVTTVVAPARAGAVELDHRAWALRVAATRARVMAGVGRVAAPAFARAGTRRGALPLSMTWAPRGAAGVRAAIRERRPDVVLATGPPVVALLAARLGAGVGGPPLVHELRDLWGG